MQKNCFCIKLLEGDWMINSLDLIFLVTLVPVPTTFAGASLPAP